MIASMLSLVTMHMLLTVALCIVDAPILSLYVTPSVSYFANASVVSDFAWRRILSQCCCKGASKLLLRKIRQASKSSLRQIL